MATELNTPALPAGSGPSGNLKSTAMLVMLAAAYTLAVIDRSLLSYMTEPLRLGAGLTDLQIGVLQGAGFAVPYALVALPSGWLADRFPRRFLIAAGLGVWSAATLAFGLCDVFEELLAARAILGAGEALLHPAAYSLLADLYRSEQRPAAMSVYSLGPVFGAVGAATLAGASSAWSANLLAAGGDALGHLPSWAPTFVLAGVPGLVLAALVVAGREPARGDQTSTRTEFVAGEFLAFARPRVGLYALLIGGFALVTLFAYGVNSWVPAFFQRAHGWSLVQVSTWSAVEGVVAGISGALVGASLPGRLMRRGHVDAVPRLIAYSIVAAAIPALLAFTIARGELAFVCIAVMDILLVVSFALPPVALQAVTPARFRGRIAGLFLFVNTLIGMTLGPLWVAVMARHGLGDTNGLEAGLIANVVVAAPLSSALLLLGLSLYRRNLVDDRI